MKRESDDHVEELIRRQPALADQAAAIRRLAEALAATARRGGTIFTCGNGGSAADADHMVGELVKRFRLPRPLPPGDRERLMGAGLPEPVVARVDAGVRAIRLASHDALTSAILNDADATLVFAQPLYVLGREGDAVLGFSTSGNSPNVIHALQVGRALGLPALGLSGEAPCRMDEVCDMVVHAPARETHLVQELHQPIMHALCLVVEEELFGGASG